MKIAVIGSGISGLSASYLLGQKHEVHLFEADKRLGGHAHTSNIHTGSKNINVDTGFLVYNDLTYPHLRSLFKHLSVETVASDMSLSIQVPHINLEWAGDNLDTVFAQRKNLFKPSFYRLLLDVLKFHKNAEINRDISREKKWSIADLLKNQKYSEQLKEWYILPMVAAIWSTPEKQMMHFPAETFLTFFINHKLLQVNDRPQWKTVKNGSINYVEKIAAHLQNIHLNEATIQVKKDGAHLKVTTTERDYLFDKVVFATNPSVTRKILHSESSAVDIVMKCFNTISNHAFLHKDESFAPKSKKCWSSWNVRANLKTAQSDSVSLTYYLNRLQPLGTDENILLTLNPGKVPENLLMRASYEHPMFNQLAIDAQKEIPSIQGIDGIYHCGAWTRYGFHEDGILSAVNVAKLFEMQTPWKIAT